MSAGGRLTWGIGPDPDDRSFGSAAEIEKYLACHPAMARLLWSRELNQPRRIERFLDPQLHDLPDPFLIRDMDKAADRAAAEVLASVARGAETSAKTIAIYGDYDVDGTCGASLLVDFFKSLGVEVLAYQPNRFTEGYGVHAAAIEKLIDQGVCLIITVDCGITAVEPARVAKSRGADVIILDHHKVGSRLPEALAVVNPQREDDESGLLNLCGSGLAFFFAMATRARLRDAGYFEARKEPNLARLLDLVAVATVADVVDVRGVNRILIAHGLKVMATRPRAGIRAMLEAAGIAQPTAMHCGFVLGPRINAAGRLKSARAAFDLLTSADAELARELARELEAINLERRRAQDETLRLALEQAEAQMADPCWAALAEKTAAAGMAPWPRALVLASAEDGPAWHEGVVGIVASKVVERFGRPAFVLAAKGTLKGSVRSIPGIDILAAISADSVAKHLVNYGGHAHAGGVSLERASLEPFREAINLHLALTSSEESFRRERRFDAEAALDELDGRLVTELEKLAPFGHRFPEPVFKVARASCSGVKVMKEKHLRLRLAGGGEAVWFNAERSPRLEGGEPCALWVSPQWNEWQGVRRLQLQVKHAELCDL